MRCRRCKDLKLIWEFPDDALGEHCEHAPTWCIYCLAKYIQGGMLEDDEDSGELECPESCCNQILDPVLCKKILSQIERLKVSVVKTLMAEPKEVKDVGSVGTITVRLFSGEFYPIQVSVNDTGKVIKQKIAAASSIEVEKQRLFYKGRAVLEQPEDGGEDPKFGSESIGFGETLHLMILLYQVDTERDSVRHIKFELSWTRKQQELRQVHTYVDGFCFALAPDGRQLGAVTYTRFQQNSLPGIQHSGPAHNLCQQTLTVDCDELQKDASQLVFALAAAPNHKNRNEMVTLQHFRDIKVALLDAATNRQLGSPFSRDKTGGEQCMLLASARRMEGAKWVIEGVGKTCRGNAYDQGWIWSAIADLNGSRNSALQMMPAGASPPQTNVQAGDWSQFRPTSQAAQSTPFAQRPEMTPASRSSGYQHAPPARDYNSRVALNSQDCVYWARVKTFSQGKYGFIESPEIFAKYGNDAWFSAEDVGGKAFSRGDQVTCRVKIGIKGKPQATDVNHAYGQPPSSGWQSSSVRQAPSGWMGPAPSSNLSQASPAQVRTSAAAAAQHASSDRRVMYGGQPFASSEASNTAGGHWNHFTPTSQPAAQDPLMVQDPWQSSGGPAAGGHRGPQSSGSGPFQARPGMEPGDWICRVCGDHQFNRNQYCRKCETPASSSRGNAVPEGARGRYR